MSQAQHVSQGWQISKRKIPGAPIRNKSLMNFVLEAKAPRGCSLSSHPPRGTLAVELPDCGVPEPRHSSKGRDVVPGRLSHSQQSGLSLFCVSVCRVLISKEGSGQLSSRQVLGRGTWEEEGAGCLGGRLAMCFSKGIGGLRVSPVGCGGDAQRRGITSS